MLKELNSHLSVPHFAIEAASKTMTKAASGRHRHTIGAQVGPSVRRAKLAPMLISTLKPSMLAPILRATWRTQWSFKTWPRR